VVVVVVVVVVHALLRLMGAQPIPQHSGHQVTLGHLSASQSTSPN